MKTFDLRTNKGRIFPCWNSVGSGPSKHILASYIMFVYTCTVTTKHGSNLECLELVEEPCQSI